MLEILSKEKRKEMQKPNEVVHELKKIKNA